MKRICICNVLLWLFACFLIGWILYPHSRFAHTDNPDLISSIRLNEEDLHLLCGETFQLRLKGTINRRASYKSSDFKVARVNQNGKITAKRKGMAIITVTQGEEVYTCKVTVTKADLASALILPPPQMSFLHLQMKQVHESAYTLSLPLPSVCFHHQGHPHLPSFP